MSETKNYEDPSWWVGMGLFLGGWATLGTQIYWYLQSAVWTPLSIIGGLRMVISKSDNWIFAPGSWLGVHSLLDSVPASAALVIIGFLVMAGAHTSG